MVVVGRLEWLDAAMRAAVRHVDHDRTRHWLAMEDQGMDTPRNVRIADEMWERIAALAEVMNRDDKTVALAGGSVSRASVLRLAVVEGVAVLERQYQDAKRRRKAG